MLHRYDSGPVRAFAWARAFLRNLVAFALATTVGSHPNADGNKNITISTRAFRVEQEVKKKAQVLINALTGQVGTRREIFGKFNEPGTSTRASLFLAS